MSDDSEFLTLDSVSDADLSLSSASKIAFTASLRERLHDHDKCSIRRMEEIRVEERFDRTCVVDALSRSLNGWNNPRCGLRQEIKILILSQR